MVKNHMKRITAPKKWQVLRKTTKFITKPNPGGHKLDLSLSINTFLKEVVELTKTTKETKYLLTKQEVLVNGVRKRSHKHQVGVLDVVTVPSANKSFRLTVSEKGKLLAKELVKDESEKTIVKISGKTMMPKGKLQINTASGINILEDVKKAKDHKIGDSLIISLKDKKIKDHIKSEKGSLVLVLTGKHSGKKGTIEDVQGKVIKIKTETETFETNKEYVLVTGKTKEEVTV